MARVNRFYHRQNGLFLDKKGDFVNPLIRGIGLFELQFSSKLPVSMCEDADLIGNPFQGALKCASGVPETPTPLAWSNSPGR